MQINFPFTTPANPFTPGLLTPAINSAALSKILSEVKLCLKLSRPLVLKICLQQEGVPGPEDLLRCWLTKVEAEVWLRIIPEPDCSKVVLANLVLLELHPPPLFWPFIKLFLLLKKGEKHIVAFDVSNSVGMHLLLGCVELLSTTGKIVFDGMLLMQKLQLWESPRYTNFLEHSWR